MSSKFNRADKVYLSRFRPVDIVDRNRWEHYYPANRLWQSGTVAPIISKQVKARTMLRSVPVPQIGDNNGIVVGADWGSPSGGSAVGGGVGSSGFSPDSGDTHGIEIGLSGYIILLWCST